MTTKARESERIKSSQPRFYSLDLVNYKYFPQSHVFCYCHRHMSQKCIMF